LASEIIRENCGTKYLKMLDFSKAFQEIAEAEKLLSDKRKKGKKP
jgi:hypothetical protein